MRSSRAFGNRKERVDVGLTGTMRQPITHVSVSRKRKHISWKTRYAGALADRPDAPPLEHLKQMTEDQLISLYHSDHNRLHAFEPGLDAYWNLRPMLIAPHREKTKLDRKRIAKSNRIIAKRKQFELKQRRRYRRWAMRRWPSRKIVSRKWGKK